MKNLCRISLILIFLTALPVLAQSGGGPYIGGSVGTTFLKTDLTDLEGNDLNIDKNNFAYKIFGGYRQGFFGVEGGYRNLGTAKNTIDEVELELKTSGFDAYGVANIRLAILIDLFAKAGIFVWNTDGKVGSAGNQDNGIDFAWGFGAGIRLGGIGIRAEWERFEISNLDNLSMLSAGVTFGFK